MTTTDGAWRERTERVFYPDGSHYETVLKWVEGADPRCDECLDRGEWIGPDGTIQPCPECGGR